MSELFDNLMKLTEETEAFYYKDFVYELDGYTYRIFNYRMAGWQQFHELNDAMECRGIMFREMPKDSWHLVSRPMEKFFNAHEGGVEHDWDDPQIIMVKEDGSLISTFMDMNGNLGLKSKGSLSSVQVLEAMNFLEHFPELYDELSDLTLDNLTVNMEWVAPSNRIVLPYDEPNLRVLNIRDNLTGEYLPMPDRHEYTYVWFHWVEDVWPENVHDFIKNVPNMKGIEGFVIRKANGEHVKLKTDEYITLHQSKDSVNNPKSLYMIAAEQATDDLRELFLDDPAALELIDKMEKEVSSRYNHGMAAITTFYADNSHRERREYAIAGQKELESWMFSAAMRKYLDEDDSYYKIAFKKQWKVWGNEIKNAVYGEEVSDEL